MSIVEIIADFAGFIIEVVIGFFDARMEKKKEKKKRKEEKKK